MSTYVAGGGTRSCNKLKSIAPKCPGAEHEIQLLNCQMNELGEAQELAVQVEDVILGSEGGQIHRHCSYILLKLLQYIDLMVLWGPFRANEQGYSPKESLNFAFSQWFPRGRDPSFLETE